MKTLYQVNAKGFSPVCYESMTEAQTLLEKLKKIGIPSSIRKTNYYKMLAKTFF